MLARAAELGADLQLCTRRIRRPCGLPPLFNRTVRCDVCELQASFSPADKMGVAIASHGMRENFRIPTQSGHNLVGRLRPKWVSFHYLFCVPGHRWRNANAPRPDRAGPATIIADVITINLRIDLRDPRQVAINRIELSIGQMLVSASCDFAHQADFPITRSNSRAQ